MPVKLLGILYDRGISLVHITQDIAQIRTYVEKLAVLYGGKRVEQTAWASILRN